MSGKRGNPYPVQVQCKQCGVMFRVRPSRGPNGAKPAKYCSSACRSNSQQGIPWGNGRIKGHDPIPMLCKGCGVQFLVAYAYRPDGAKPSKGYCTQACFVQALRDHRVEGMGSNGFQRGHPGNPRKGRIPWNKGKTCPQTSGERNGMFGRTHTPEVRELLSRQTSAQLSELTRQRLAGAQAPLRRSDPLYSQIFRVGWRTIRRKALERDGHTCRVCGTVPKRPNVHHIVPFSIVLEHELGNLITLCGPCHNAAHRGTLDLVARAA